MQALSKESFFSLYLTQQIKAIYSEGKFIVAIRYYKYKVNLYQIEDYFIEVFYNHKLDQLESIQLLSTNNKRIKFYTDQIKLPDHFKA